MNEKFTEILAMRNAAHAQYLNVPVAAYTHTTNREITVSAVDVDTDTFTSAGHGLANGDQLYPILNYAAGLVYLPSVLPGGIGAVTTSTAYYVVNKTNDTFQLSLTLGGAAIDLTTNASMDLTKWHFETLGARDITFSNLGNLTRVRLELIGKTICSYGGDYIVLPEMNLAASEWVSGASTTFTTGNVSTYFYGDVFFRAEVTIDYSKYYSVKVEGVCIQSNTSSANSAYLTSSQKANMLYFNGTIDGLRLAYLYPANGMIIEVYKL